MQPRLVVLYISPSHPPTPPTPTSVGAAVVGAAEKYADTPPLRLLLRLLVPRAMCELAVRFFQRSKKRERRLLGYDSIVGLRG